MRNCRVVVASVDYVEACRLAKLIGSNEIGECAAVELKDDTSIAHITDGAPDLIILDLPRDEEQRLKQVRQIKRQQATAEAVVIALYRAHGFSRFGALIGAGVSSCIRKSPFDKELGEAIRGVVRFWIGPSSLPYRIHRSDAQKIPFEPIPAILLTRAIKRGPW